jgi:hypothetical protein
MFDNQTIFPYIFRSCPELRTYPNNTLPKMTTPNKSLEEEAPMPNEFIYEDASATEKPEVPDNTDGEDALQTQEASTERTIVTATDINIDSGLVVREEEPSDYPRYIMSGALPPSSDTSSSQPAVPRTIQPQTTVSTPLASLQDGNTTNSGLSSSNRISIYTKYRAEADAENRRSDGTSLAVPNDPDRKARRKHHEIDQVGGSTKRAFQRAKVPQDQGA